MTFQQLDSCCEFDPSIQLEALLSRVPARWVVYLFADADSRPIQLLCVRNLRASLRRRLGESQADEPSKRVDYRQLVRRIYWRRVDSELEADLLYFDVARQLYPASYQKLTAINPAWFVHVDADSQFPRYTRTDHPVDSIGTHFGPLQTKNDAQELIEKLEDWFDLCRYHNVLVQSPNGKPCAYKEMGKCPAPCDGSVSLDSYRRLIQLSVQAISDPGDFIRAQQSRMKQAAGALNFEAAGKIKQYVESLSKLGQGPFRFLRPLKDLRFISLQRGPSAKTAKVFFITPTTIRPIACLMDAPKPGAGIVQMALNEARSPEPMDRLAVERFGIVAKHLFAEKPSGGFLAIDQLNETTLARAYREILKQKLSDETDDEGIIRELQPVSDAVG